MKRLILFFALVLALAACGSSQPVQTPPQATPTSAALTLQSDAATASALETAAAATVTETLPPSPTPTTPVPSPTPHSDLGMTQQSGPWQVTLNDVRTSQGDQAFTPKAGNTYLLIGVTLHNTASSTQVANEAVLFTLRDTDGNQYTETALLDDQVIFGSVVAGQSLRGHLVYEVPKSARAFVLQCQNDFDVTTVVQWQVSV